MKTNATTESDQYKTAFVKVYQDAGVIGVSMLTLLVLCLLLGIFCLRLLKMYTTLTESRDNLDATRTAALERVAQTMLLLQHTFSTEITSLKQEHTEHYSKLDKLSSESERKLELLRREEIQLDRVLDRLTQIDNTIARGK